MGKPLKYVIAGTIPALAALAMVVLIGCEPPRQPQPIGGGKTTTLKSETLIASSVAIDDDLFHEQRWCGNRGVFILMQSGEVWLTDIHARERIRLDVNRYDVFLGCDPDGRKLFYIDYTAPRSEDKLRDLYEYDIASGVRSVVASVVGGTPYDALSPDGTKILLGARHRLSEMKGRPDLEPLWFSVDEGGGGFATWFRDSSGVVTSGKDFTNELCVEFFGKGGWRRCFEQKKGKETFKTDRQGWVYYIEYDPFYNDYGGDEASPEVRQSAQVKSPVDTSRYLNRCVITGRKLDCERTLEAHDFMRAFDFLPDGDVIFKDYKGEDCIRRGRPGNRTAPCVIGTKGGAGTYDYVSPIGVSPDGKLFAFERYRKMKGGGDDAVWRTDLFTTELETR